MTGADDTLYYDEVFNPSVVPFKRMSALDAVLPDGTLAVSSARREPVPVGGSPDPERDLFWASMRLELAPGRAVPIPSVAPDMRILSYEAEPEARIEFSADAARNFYARADSARGEHRVVLLVDADADYFGAAIPPHVRVRDIPRSQVPPVPAPVRTAAERALRRRGLHRGLRVTDALEILTRHFRSFEPGEPPPDTGDLYWDLVTSQTGVCRHRAFAFVITASALGLPARYVTNEAHAFTEVFVPGPGWMRVDLGGAAQTLEVANASGKSMHQPREPDPFAKPEPYTENYTRLEVSPTGNSPRRASARHGRRRARGPRIPGRARAARERTRAARTRARVAQNRARTRTPPPSRPGWVPGAISRRSRTSGSGGASRSGSR